jgi:rare lipoprotein A
MQNFQGVEQTPVLFSALRKTFPRILAATALVAVSALVAKDTALPASALPAPLTVAPQPVQPADVMAPVATGTVTTLTRVKSGMASWYGAVLDGHRTASGKRFNMYELTAAHRDLPFGTRVKVTDLRNNRTVIVTITDRGVLFPERVIDLSYEAARQLQMIKSGVDPVTLEVLTTQDVALSTH